MTVRDRRAAKSFTPGQAVDIQRDVGSAWEPATYKNKFTDWKDWHSVRLPDGARRRINTMTGEPCGPDDPYGTLVDVCSVPTRRIRIAP